MRLIFSPIAFVALRFVALAIACSTVLLVRPAIAWQADAPTEQSSSRRNPTEAVTDDEESVEQPAATSTLDVRPASFKEITPGKTTLQEAKTALGKPVQEISQDKSTTLVYRLDPFPKVEIALHDNVVQSIVIYLEEPTPAAAIAKELGLSDFRSADVLDEKGQKLGQVYPERGILFGLAAKPGNGVAQILLETITAEPFLLRVQQDTGYHYSRNLADLDQAIRLEPDNAEHHFLRCEILAAIGRESEALASAQQAVKLKPESAVYRLAEARLLAALGIFEQAGKRVEALQKLNGLEPIWQARAEMLQGDLLSSGPGQDFNKASQRHMAAIAKAIPLATDKRDDVRRRGKQLLIEAHLAVAGDIAWGKWKSKTKVVPQWLERATALVAESQQNESPNPAQRILLHRKTLSVMTGMGGRLDPTAAAEALRTEGGKLIAASDAPLYRRKIKWQVGEGLLDAARIERVRGNADKSLAHANAALELFRPSNEQDRLSATGDRLMGEAHYFIGSHHAIFAKDHSVAIQWYDKAVAHYARPLPAESLLLRARQGEQLVSMGVSYWQSKKYERGIELTRRGVELLKEAVSGGAATTKTLIIPYGNLSSMLRQTGNEQESQQITDLIGQLEKVDGASRQR